MNSHVRHEDCTTNATCGEKKIEFSPVLGWAKVMKTEGKFECSNWRYLLVINQNLKCRLLDINDSNSRIIDNPEYYIDVMS